MKDKILIYAIATILLLSATSISLAYNQQQNIVNNNEQIQPSNPQSMDEVDQSQLISVEGMFLPAGRFPLPDLVYNIYSAQSFIPTRSILSRIELYVGKNSTTTYPLTVAIRDNLSQENIVELSVPPNQIVTENFSWVEWNFSDTALITGSTYYMVAYTQNVTDNWYAWAGNNDRYSYPHGCAWVSIDEGGTWTNDSANEQIHPVPQWCGTTPHTRTNESDMCFITYGYDNLPPEAPDISGKIKGKVGVEYTYTFTVIDPNDNDIYLYINWGDSCPAINWTGPYTSGEPINLSHTYEQKGDYTIGAKARDIFDEEGPWGYLEISIPTTYNVGISRSLILKALMRILNILG